MTCINFRSWFRIQLSSVTTARFFSKFLFFRFDVLEYLIVSLETVTKLSYCLSCINELQVLNRGSKNLRSLGHRKMGTILKLWKAREDLLSFAPCDRKATINWALNNPGDAWRLVSWPKNPSKNPKKSVLTQSL